ncbi:MAG: DUF2818 domain-containing protein [Ideonella sp. MAG2]|nr:MAG: DUF2818 domain-containing protein [Ideonella sp. MAG2]
MTSATAVWVVLVLAVLAANLPFVNERLMVLGPKRAPKPFAWRLLELVILGGLTLVAGSLMESSLGQRAPQRWEFYAAFVCLFVTLAFPGFIWRYLRKQPSADV